MLVLLRKEMKEILRSAKIYVVPLVFMLFAITSPFLAKYTQEILDFFSSMSNQPMNMQLPEPTFTDSFLQFYSNLNPIVLWVILFMFAGTMVDEKSKGTGILVLTKGVSRQKLVMSKFLALFGFFTLVFVVGSLCFAPITQNLFPETQWDKAIWSLLIYWLYCMMYMSVIVMSSVISKSYSISALISFSVYITFTTLEILPFFNRYTPSAISRLAIKVMTMEMPINEIFWPIFTTGCVILVAVILATISFRRQEI